MIWGGGQRDRSGSHKLKVPAWYGLGHEGQSRALELEGQCDKAQWQPGASLSVYEGEMGEPSGQMYPGFCCYQQSFLGNLVCLLVLYCLWLTLDSSSRAKCRERLWKSSCNLNHRKQCCLLGGEHVTVKSAPLEWWEYWGWKEWVHRGCILWNEL